jgi:hypothetical protein
MASVQDNFTIDAGGTLTREFIYKDDNGDTIDISGYLARAQVRKSAFRELVFSSVPTIDEETFVITMTWTPEQTSLLVDSNYVYGLEIYDEESGDVVVLTRGVLTINQEIVK